MEPARLTAVVLLLVSVASAISHLSEERIRAADFNGVVERSIGGTDDCSGTVAGRLTKLEQKVSDLTGAVTKLQGELSNLIE